MMDKTLKGVLLMLAAHIWLLCNAAPSFGASMSGERILSLTEITNQPTAFRADVGESGQFTWWLPEGADEYVLPITAGIVVDPARSDLMRLLEKGSP